MSQLVNTSNDRKEKTLSNQFLIIHDITHPIDITQESWCFENFVDNLNQDSIHHNILNLINTKPLRTDPQFGGLISLFESMLTLVSLPDLNHIPKSVLTHVSVNFKLESLISQNHIPLMRNEYEPQFFYLDPILEPILTLEPCLI